MTSSPPTGSLTSNFHGVATTCRCQVLEGEAGVAAPCIPQYPQQVGRPQSCGHRSARAGVGRGAMPEGAWLLLWAAVRKLRDQEDSPRRPSLCPVSVNERVGQSWPTDRRKWEEGVRSDHVRRVQSGLVAH